MLKVLLNETEVVAELKNGPLKTERALKALLIFLAFAGIAQLAGSLLQVGAKSETTLQTFFIAAAVGALGVGVGYLIGRLIVTKLYKANGGDAGERFIERLFVLSLSSGLRMFLPLAFILLVSMGLFSWVLPRLDSVVLISLFTLVFVVAVTAGPIVYLYFQVKKGLLAINASSAPSL